ncbi:MAG: HDOD domain-containing protein [Gammaproteobacteria bacterium]
MIDVKTLLAINDFSQLSDVALIDIASHAEILLVKKGKALNAKDTSHKKLFLLEGKLDLHGIELSDKAISENTERAQKPIFRFHSPGLNAKCISDSTLLCIDSKVVNKYVDAADKIQTGMFVDTVKIDTLKESGNDIIEEITERFDSKDFNLPSLPEMALHVNKALEDESINMNVISSTLQSDPAITARIIQVSNSALFRTGQPIDSLQAAITRIGLEAVRSIVISVVMRDMFHPQTNLVKKTMKRYYEHSIRIGVICYVLAKRCKGFDPDHAFLAGLLHDIGVIPLLVVADQHNELSRQAGKLDEVLSDLKGTVGSILLRQWEFDVSYALTSEQAYQWERESTTTPDYCDLVQVALLHSNLVGGEKIKGPSLMTLPAFKRLNLGDSDPAEDIQKLTELSQRISEMMNKLG